MTDPHTTPATTEPPFVTERKRLRRLKGTQGRTLGEKGEKHAAKWLWKRGYRILEHNWRGKAGEIDIIVERKGRIHFVEVKTAQVSEYGDPEDRVDAAKRHRLRAAAREWLSAFDETPEAGVQFDVLAQSVGPDANIQECDLMEDAF